MCDSYPDCSFFANAFSLLGQVCQGRKKKHNPTFNVFLYVRIITDKGLGQRPCSSFLEDAQN